MRLGCLTRETGASGEWVDWLSNDSLPYAPGMDEAESLLDAMIRKGSEVLDVQGPYAVCH